MLRDSLIVGWYREGEKWYYAGDGKFGTRFRADALLLNAEEARSVAISIVGSFVENVFDDPDFQ